jgi:hypothetical protein
MIRSVSVAVLPDPAAADTSRVLPNVLMAAFCAGVQFLSINYDRFRRFKCRFAIALLKRERSAPSV